MTVDQDNTPAELLEEPTEPGWYAYSGGRQTMIFHLRDALDTIDESDITYKKQWSVHLDNGTAANCEWGYIEQALGVWDLIKIDLPEE